MPADRARPLDPSQVASRRRIVVVDDSRMQRAAISDMLAATGFEPMVYESGGAALAAVERFEPLAVLLDINLASESGLDLCRAIRQRSSRIAVLLITGRQDPDDVRAGMAAGADDYLVKPVDEMILAAALERVLAPTAAWTSPAVAVLVGEPALLVSEKGAAVSVDLHRLNELGATLLTDGAVAPGSHFELIASALARLDIDPAFVRVVACRDVVGGPRRHLVETAFWGLQPGARDSLRRFLYAHRRF